MKYCLIGEKIDYSYSELIHNSCGLDYSIKQVKINELNSLICSDKYIGFNITIPYKQQIIPYLDFTSDLVKRIGAVNTVIKKDNRLYGYNTDYFGVQKTFEYYNVDVLGKKVVILGSGATSKTVQCYLEDNKAKKIIIISRKGNYNYSNIENFNDADILINTTPVGTYPNLCDSLINIDNFNNLTFVFDLTYNPNKTLLLQQAERKNIKFSNGITTLIYQALYSQKIWGLSVDFDKSFDIIYKKIIEENLNIVLYGMPSCGKSTIGKELSKKLNKKFYDSDDIFYVKYGVKPQNYILEFGEKAFRDKEEIVIKELSLNKGCIISLGGGSVLRRSNVERLKSNGLMFYINRNLDKLTIENRPISENKGIKTLFDERKEIYNSIYDYVIDNNGQIENSVREIVKNYENYCNKRR